MELFFHRHFKKQFKKLPLPLQRKTQRTISQLRRNPHHPSLRNHPLRGNFIGQRAISVTGDVRIVFREEGSYERVTLLRVGSHSEAYK